MLLYFHEVPLNEGFEVLKKSKEDRLVHGQRVSACSGWQLFRSLEGQPIRCCWCGCEADRWIADGHPKNLSPPVLNLYAINCDGALVLMTRDHIIPRSLGGTDSTQNLRPACMPCNGARGNTLTAAELEFRRMNPHLISKDRLERGKRLAKKAAELQKNNTFKVA